LVMQIGEASIPCSLHAQSAISPLPLNEWMPANAASVQTSERGQIAVTQLPPTPLWGSVGPVAPG
jgi:hypothetical protein